MLYSGIYMYKDVSMLELYPHDGDKADPTKYV